MGIFVVVGLLAFIAGLTASVWSSVIVEGSGTKMSGVVGVVGVVEVEVGVGVAVDGGVVFGAAVEELFCFFALSALLVLNVNHVKGLLPVP